MAQLDRPLVVLSCAAPARGYALSRVVHHTELADGGGLILRRGLLDPWQRLRVVHIHTEAIVEHGADLVLAKSVTILGTDLVRRHRTPVVDRRALAPEEDIANDQITQETLNRQNEIIEHLLEAEKAEQERDKEEKREAKEAEQLPHQVQDMLDEYKKNKLKQAELLKTIPPKLKPYYKEKVKEYFQNIDQN